MVNIYNIIFIQVQEYSSGLVSCNTHTNDKSVPSLLVHVWQTSCFIQAHKRLLRHKSTRSKKVMFLVFVIAGIKAVCAEVVCSMILHVFVIPQKIKSNNNEEHTLLRVFSHVWIWHILTKSRHFLCRTCHVFVKMRYAHAAQIRHVWWPARHQLFHLTTKYSWMSHEHRLWWHA